MSRVRYRRQVLAHFTIDNLLTMPHIDDTIFEIEKFLLWEFFGKSLGILVFYFLVMLRIFIFVAFMCVTGVIQL
jgi:hypothetical protein